MTTKFRTESGSVYTLENGNWSSTSGSTRTQEGQYIVHSDVIVGQPVEILAPPLVEGAILRIITTSPVVEVL